MAGVVARPACYASSHPGHLCKCFQAISVHTRLSPNSHQTCTHKLPFQATRTKERSLQACSALAERPIETQELQSSNVVTDTLTSDNALLNTVDDPQESIAHQADVVGPSTGPDSQAQGSAYTKAERASLANIPESQMTPEMLRRWRISRANKGKQPWNKGRQHRPETIARIRERTRAAMLRPEVLARVRANHPSLKHTSVTKAKIGASVSATRKQSGALRPKQAKASNKEETDPSGSPPKKESKELKPKQKPVKKAPAAKTASVASDTPGSADTGTSATGSPNKSAPAEKRVMAEEHRKRISAAIRQKWADPEYRMRTLSGMKSGVVQAKRQSTVRVRAVERSREARAQLLAARVRQDKLMEARRTVEALQSALEAGQIQTEALRGDPEGFARQQLMLNDASELVTLARAKVAELEANTPSFKEVAAELGAKSTTGNCELTAEEEELVATPFVQEVEFDNAAYHGQQLQLEAEASRSSQLDPTASSHSEQSGGSQSSQDTVHSQLARSSSSASPQLSPTHIYRHGRLQHDGTNGSTDTSSDNTAAELQPA